MTNVIFEKPNYENLIKQGYTCVDMHSHSRYSDGLSSLRSLHNKCKKLGIGIALTDHNEIRGSLKLSKNKDIFVIPGMETTASEGIHTLFYFYDKKELKEFYNKTIKPNLSKNPFSDLKISVIDLIESAGKYNCKICSAHPFGPMNSGMHKFAEKEEYKKILKKIDFIEALNSAHLHSENIRAERWGDSMGKGLTGGSDAHATVFLGKVVTCTKSRDDFLDSIGKESIVVGKEVNSSLLMLRHILNLRLFSKFPKFYIKKMISYMSK